MPKEQREQYDREQMSRDMRNTLALWAAVSGAGGVLAYLFSSAGIAVISMIAVLILFFGKYIWTRRRLLENIS